MLVQVLTPNLGSGSLVVDQDGFVYELISSVTSEGYAHVIKRSDLLAEDYPNAGAAVRIY